MFDGLCDWSWGTSGPSAPVLGRDLSLWLCLFVGKGVVALFGEGLLRGTQLLPTRLGSVIALSTSVVCYYTAQSAGLRWLARAEDRN